MALSLELESPLMLIKGKESFSKFLKTDSLLLKHILTIRTLIKRAFPSITFHFRPPCIRCMEPFTHASSAIIECIMGTYSKALEGKIVETTEVATYNVALTSKHKFVIRLGSTLSGWPLHVTIAYFPTIITDTELSLCRSLATQPILVFTPSELQFVSSFAQKSSTALTVAEQQAILFEVDLHATPAGFPNFPLTLLSPHQMLAEEEKLLCKFLKPKGPLYHYLLTKLLHFQATPVRADQRFVVELELPMGSVTSLELERLRLGMEFAVYSSCLEGQIVDVSERSNYIERHGCLALVVGRISKMQEAKCYILLKRLMPTDTFISVRSIFIDDGATT